MEQQISSSYRGGGVTEISHRTTGVMSSGWNLGYVITLRSNPDLEGNTRVARGGKSVELVGHGSIEGECLVNVNGDSGSCVTAAVVRLEPMCLY